MRVLLFKLAHFALPNKLNFMRVVSCDSYIINGFSFLYSFFYDQSRSGAWVKHEIRHVERLAIGQFSVLPIRYIVK